MRVIRVYKSLDPTSTIHPTSACGTVPTSGVPSAGGCFPASQPSSLASHAAQLFLTNTLTEAVIAKNNLERLARTVERVSNRKFAVQVINVREGLS